MVLRPCRDLPWPAAEADAADGRWLGCYVYTPHYQAVTAAVHMPPSADLQHAIDGLLDCAPGAPAGLFPGMVPIRPQRFPGYLQVIRFPTFLRQVHDGYAAVMCDLTHVGGPYFPTVLPRGLSHADLVEYLLPLTRILRRRCAALFHWMQIQSMALGGSGSAEGR